MDTQIKSKSSFRGTSPDAPSLDVSKLAVVKKKKPFAGAPRAAKMLRDDVKGLSAYVPKELLDRPNQQTAIPAIAKDKKLLLEIAEMVRQVPTDHKIYNCDSRSFDVLAPNSVHLVVTSPPYWTLKDYNVGKGQMGYIANYEEFLSELDRVWATCLNALVPGGRLICVVGDVCLSRRKNGGEHTVVPLHASIQEHCRKLGYSNIAPIIWYKIANAVYEAQGNGGGFLGKPYEPNAVIKNDIEFILMERKPGGYRQPSMAERILSVISAENYSLWFQQIWSGVTGASTRSHPAPYPLELAERLIRMFSFVGDTVVDPFLGTGTTSVAAAKWGRNSIGIEVDPHYFKMAKDRLHSETSSLLAKATIQIK
jgi:DNA modification methylase